MANTYKLIASTVLSSTASVVSFTSIPQTYKDLVLRFSARNSGTAEAINLYFQPYDFTVERTTMVGNGTTATASTDTADAGIYLDFLDGTNRTASTFSSAEYYIHNYSVSGQHFTSTFGVMENNGTSANITINGSVDTKTTTYSQIDLNPGNNFVAGSSFYLYGISNS